MTGTPNLAANDGSTISMDDIYIYHCENRAIHACVRVAFDYGPTLGVSADGITDAFGFNLSD